MLVWRDAHVDVRGATYGPVTLIYFLSITSLNPLMSRRDLKVAMNSPDSVGATPEWTGVPDSQVPSRKVDLSLVRRRQARRFIPPIPLYWFNRACRLPGKALAV